MPEGKFFLPLLFSASVLCRKLCEVLAGKTLPFEPILIEIGSDANDSISTRLASPED
jgi:hypothetical protein